MTDRDEKTIEKLVTGIDQFLHPTKKILWRHFLLGLFYGLGASVGVALLLTLAGFIFRELGGLPVIGEWLNSLSNSLPLRY